MQDKEKKVVKISSNHLTFLLVLSVVVVGLIWFYLAKILVPDIIVSAYHGKSFSFFDQLFSGEPTLTLDRYLRRWEIITWGVMILILGLGVVILFNRISFVKIFFTTKPLGINLLIFLLWLVFTGFALVGLQNPKAMFVHSTTFLFLTLGFANLKPFRTLVSPLSKVYKLILLGLILLLFYSQLTNRNHKLFPFVDWTMYSRHVRTPEISYYEYEGVTTGGRTFLLNPTELFPSLKHGRIQAKLRELAKKAVMSENSENQPKIYSLLTAIGNMYNLRNPDDPVHSIKVYRRTFDIEHYRDDSSISKELLWNVKVKN